MSEEMDTYLERIGQHVFEQKGLVRGIISAQEVYDASDGRYTLAQVQAWFDDAPELPSAPSPTGWADPFFGSGLTFEE